MANRGCCRPWKTLIEHETAGSPVDEGIRWTNRSPPDLAEELQDRGFSVGADTVRRMLNEELGLPRRQAFKDEAGVPLSRARRAVSIHRQIARPSMSAGAGR